MDTLNRVLILALLLLLLYGVYKYQEHFDNTPVILHESEKDDDDEEDNKKNDINLDNISQFSIGSLNTNTLSFMDDGSSNLNDKDDDLF